MTYEPGNDRPVDAPQGRGKDPSAHGRSTPSARGIDAEPDALHDPVQAEQQQRTARDFGVTGAGASSDVGPLRRPPGESREAAGAGHVPGQDQHLTPPSAPPTGTGHRPEAEHLTGGRDTGGHLGGETHQPGLHQPGDAHQPGGLHQPGGAHQPGAGAQLLPHGERDKLGLRLQQAVNQFVDEPRRAVEEADHVLEETVRHLTETLAEHRRSLRGGWESRDQGTETEELRVALRKYREVTERLLQI
ncbi:hypothetical protein ACIO3O_40950 [Streptomyces sp. NPDC087440]|uniref:hypothetical protein n=1 Tax=Streptomyces sp. NPDC087440 TaxID=3365790 RepID=UPI003810C0BA